MCCGKSRNTTVTPKFSCNLNTIAWLSLHGLKEHTINLYLPVVVIHTVGNLNWFSLCIPSTILAFFTPSEDINFLIRQLLASAFFCIWVLCSHCEKWNKPRVCSWWVIQENIAPPPHLGEQLKWRKMLFSSHQEELCTFDNLQPLPTQIYLSEKVRKRLHIRFFSLFNFSVNRTELSHTIARFKILRKKSVVDKGRN